MRYPSRVFALMLLVASSAVAGCMTSTSTSSGPLAPSSIADVPSASMPSLLGTWRSVALRPTARLTSVSATAAAAFDPTSCGSFQFVVASQQANSISGQFTAVCQGNLVSGEASGQLTTPTTVSITVNGSGTLPGVGVCSFSLSANGPLENDTLRLDYSGTSCAGPFSGRETLRKDDVYPDPPTPEPPPPPPPPDPTPIPPPPPPPPGNQGPVDELDLSTVSIALGVDLRDWPKTSTMTEAYRNGSDLCTWHTKAGQWPRISWFGTETLVEGNQWIFARINGKWYGGAGEWLRPGQQCKNVDGHIGEGAFGGTVMEHWTPSPGELIGVAVSTPARAGQWGGAERSQVVLIRW